MVTKDHVIRIFKNLVGRDPLPKDEEAINAMVSRQASDEDITDLFKGLKESEDYIRSLQEKPEAPEETKEPEKKKEQQAEEEPTQPPAVPSAPEVPAPEEPKAPEPQAVAPSKPAAPEPVLYRKPVAKSKPKKMEKVTMQELDKMSVNELKKMGKKLGLTVHGKKKKEIVKILYKALND